MQMSRLMLGGLVILSGLSHALDVARADCAITGIRSITGATAALGTYSGTTTPVAKPMTLTLTLNVTGTGDCTFAIAFASTTNPASMSGVGTDRLRYDVQTPSGTSLVYTSTPSATATKIVSHTSASQIVADVSLQAVAIAGQTTVAAGGYSDASLGIAVFNGTATITPVSIWPGTFINAAVNPSCKIDGRTAANDAAGVRVPVSSSGVVTTSAIQRDYANVVCNAPSDISMSSQNGGITNPATVSGQIVNVIHYSAEARLGGVTATLDTASAGLTSLGKIDATSGASGTMSVIVTPQQPPQGYTLISGRYSDVLSVTLTPR